MDTTASLGPSPKHRADPEPAKSTPTRALVLQPVPPKPIDCWLSPFSSPMLLDRKVQNDFTPSNQKEHDRETEQASSSPRNDLSHCSPTATSAEHPSEYAAPEPVEKDSSARSGSLPTADIDQSCSTGAIKPRGSQLLTLTVRIPPDQPQIQISVPDTATVADAVHACSSLNPSLVGCGLIFRGKVLTQKPKEELKSFGVHDGMTLYAILHSVNPAVVHLAEIKADLDSLKAPFIDEAGSLVTLDSRRTHAFYEDSMKLLYRLDNLEGLPDDLRAERKALVKEIQHLQDVIHEQPS